MIIDLPLETWADLLAFLPSRQLAENVPEIGNRQFASFAQFTLHKCGQITFGDFHIQSSFNGDGAVIIKAERVLPLADVRMPENVKNFQEIRINYFDASVLCFLRKFQQNNLLTGVNLYLNKNINLLALARILPLITSVNCIKAYDTNAMALFQNEYSRRLAMPVLQSAIVLCICFNPKNYWFYRWLRTPREDGEPRVLNLIANMLFDVEMSDFVEQVKKDFMQANDAVSFLIKLFWFKDEKFLDAFFLDNFQTRERLVCAGYDQDKDSVTILRFPMDATEEWIEAMGTEQPDGRNSRKIEIDVKMSECMIF